MDKVTDLSPLYILVMLVKYKLTAYARATCSLSFLYWSRALPMLLFVAVACQYCAVLIRCSTATV